MLPAALVTTPVSIFFIVLVIILLAPLLLNKLKIPHIVGMIVAGVAIGPHGFNVLDTDAAFDIFGQVGLLYLMFLAGLEIDMFHLRLNLRRGFLFGILTLCIPLLLGVLTGVFILNVGWLSALLLGAMFSAHTLIAYPVAARFGISRAPAVLVSVVGTIIAVTGSLLVIAIVTNFHAEGYFNIASAAWLIAKIVIWAAAIIYAFPRITRQFFKLYSDRVTQYVFVLTLVFCAAVTARFIGLESILGAFLAGLVLNRYIPSGSPLMSSIEFVGNALFIPYFLIGVGMMINLRVVANLHTLIVAAIMLCVAIISKWLPAFIIAKKNGYSHAASKVMFGLTVAHTAVALAVVALGYKMDLLTGTILNATILVILITCTAAPIITASGAAKLKISMVDEDSVVRHIRHNNSLIAVSNPITVPSIVELAVLMRNSNGTHSFAAIHVRADNDPTSKSISKQALKLAKDTAAAANVSLLEIERYDLNFVTGILNAIAERDTTEIILGMHHRSTVIDSFFGSKIEQLLRATNKMVILTRLYTPINTVTRIVVSVPASAQYETGFSRWVRALARLTRQLSCRIIFCCHDDIQPIIRGVIYHENFGIRCEFRTVNSHDEMIVLSGRILDDDLFVVISARPNSVSYSDETSDMPDLLQRNFARNSLIVIYPEQFGEEEAIQSFTDPVSADISSYPTTLRRHFRNFLSALRSLKK